ncbi:MAG TPA: hypothetical protein VFV93_18385 [Thermomicrobiales bacterium]|nr:hypothetical protein [Thermomicrobiales bacterium]
MGTTIAIVLVSAARLGSLIGSRGQRIPLRFMGLIHCVDRNSDSVGQSVRDFPHAAGYAHRQTTHRRRVMPLIKSWRAVDLEQLRDEAVDLRSLHAGPSAN